MATLNQNDTSAWKRQFDRFFKPAYREIDFLKIKINQQDGLMFFKWHKYTVNELTDSEHHRKIDSVTQKIGDDVSNLYRRGEIPDNYKEMYEDYKTEVEDKLHEVNKSIFERQPTWLERAWQSLTEFVEKVKDNMPPLVRNLIEGAGVFIVRNLPGFGFLGRLLLPSARPKDI